MVGTGVLLGCCPTYWLHSALDSSKWSEECLALSLHWCAGRGCWYSGDYGGRDAFALFHDDIVFVGRHRILLFTSGSDKGRISCSDGSLLVLFPLWRV